MATSTEQRQQRTLIGEWTPPSENSGPEIDLPDHLQVKAREHTNYNDEGGIRYQRCGGGYRVIRKGIGGS